MRNIAAPRSSARSCKGPAGTGYPTSVTRIPLRAHYRWVTSRTQGMPRAATLARLIVALTNVLEARGGLISLQGHLAPVYAGAATSATRAICSGFGSCHRAIIRRWERSVVRDRVKRDSAGAAVRDESGRRELLQVPQPLRAAAAGCHRSRHAWPAARTPLD
jgi:hypothetical protein